MLWQGRYGRDTTAACDAVAGKVLPACRLDASSSRFLQRFIQHSAVSQGHGCGCRACLARGPGAQAAGPTSAAGRRLHVNEPDPSCDPRYALLRL